jgi:glycosyltransferase involved in cell wall biosynthesis
MASRLKDKRGEPAVRIALAHFRVGETDGVSLEMEKWRIVLERLGHEVLFLAGSQGTTDTPTHIIEELHYKHPLNEKFVKNAYDHLKDYPTEAAFQQEIRAFSSRMEQKLVDFIKRERIDRVVSNNIWSLGWNLPAGLAFTEAAEKTGIPFFSHHHDFYWERERYHRPTCSFVTEWLNTYFPPNRPNVHHVVINRIAQQELKKRRGIDATVVPNVFDFEAPTWRMDEYNRDFRHTIGLSEDDLVILQATRIAERKAIELGIDFVAQLQSNQHTLENNRLYNGKKWGSENHRIVYLLAGLPESSAAYVEQLKGKAAALGVDMRFIGSHIEHSRKTIGGKKIYSLWDAYVHADFITYPSILEGWGNQLLEAVFAKVPMLVYEYPVYLTDIKDHPFSFISLGSTHTRSDSGLVEVDPAVTRQAAAEAAEILTDHERYGAITERNFTIAKKHYSYEALTAYLVKLVEPVTTIQS